MRSGINGILKRDSKLELFVANSLLRREMGALLKAGTEWNGTEYTGTRQNDAGMRRNGQE